MPGDLSSHLLKQQLLRTYVSMKMKAQAHTRLPKGFTVAGNCRSPATGNCPVAKRNIDLQ